MDKTYKCVVTGKLYNRNNHQHFGNTYYLDILDDAGEMTGKTITINSDTNTESFTVNEMVQIIFNE